MNTVLLKYDNGNIVTLKMPDFDESECVFQVGNTFFAYDDTTSDGIIFKEVEVVQIAVGEML